MIKAKKFNSYEEMPDIPGSYCIHKGAPFFVLPCGHNFYPQIGTWKMQDIEDENKISLSPSILCSPQIPCWHGYLTNGEFKQV